MRKRTGKKGEEKRERKEARVPFHARGICSVVWAPRGGWSTAADAIAAPLEEDLKFLSELGLEGTFALRAHEERDESTRVDFLG